MAQPAPRVEVQTTQPSLQPVPRLRCARLFRRPPTNEHRRGLYGLLSFALQTKLPRQPHFQPALGWTWLDSSALLMLHICSTTRGSTRSPSPPCSVPREPWFTQKQNCGGGGTMCEPRWPLQGPVRGRSVVTQRRVMSSFGGCFRCCSTCVVERVLPAQEHFSGRRGCWRFPSFFAPACPTRVQGGRPERSHAGSLKVRPSHRLL